MNKHLIISITVAASLFATNAHAESGETWDVTTRTEMPGMPYAMPESTATICIPKGAEKDPNRLMKQDGDCEMTDVKTSGSKTTWKMRCDNDGQEMSGTGVVTYKADSYQGTTRLSGKSGGQAVNMTANYQGKRVGTPCDTANTVVAIKGMENMNDMMGMANKQMASAMSEQCEISNYETTELISGKFFGPTAACPGKEKFACKVIGKDVVKNVEVYVKLSKHDDTSEVSISTICGINMPASTQAICKKVDSGNYEELAEYCPAEAKAFEAERNDSSASKSTGIIPSNPVDSTLDKAKKLKGLLGF